MLSSLLATSFVLAVLTWVADRAKHDHVLGNGAALCVAQHHILPFIKCFGPLYMRWNLLHIVETFHHLVSSQRHLLPPQHLCEQG